MPDSAFDPLSTLSLLPYSVCLRDDRSLIALLGVSDALIALACFAIPLALGGFFRRRSDLGFSRLFMGFASFIFATGVMHALDVWTLWYPDFHIQAVVKAFTAVLAAVTAAAMWSMRRKALSLPSPEQLTRVNAELTRKVLEHAAMVHKLEVEAKLRASLEQKLRNSEQQLKTVLDTAADGILTTNAKGQIELCNPAAAHMFGYAPHQLTLMSPESLMTAPEADGETYQDQSGHGLEVVGKRKDGSTFPLEMSIGGNTRILRDITQRKAQEQAIHELNASLERKVEERTRQLNVASAAKSLFLANMSHELRTPMNAILGLAQLMAHETLTPEQQDIVARIRLAGKSLIHIIDDILDITKLEAGQVRIERKSFDLTASLQQLDDLMRNSAQAKGIRLNIRKPDLQVGPLVGDVVRLQQVLTNLTGNAIKFTEHGQVVVDVLTVRDSPDSVKLRFEVRDTGIGIAPEALPNLFTAFTQADTSITRRFGGTGLGLAISRRLVELMGGTMDVSSRLGEGSTFRFELTFERDLGDYGTGMVEAEEPVETDTRSSGPQLAGLRILVVDDSAMNRFMVERVLKLAGAVPTLANDGKQALERIKTTTSGFDAVLMDIQMPVMDGLSATRAIREDPAHATLPVVAFTAGVLDEEREAALAAGVNDFLGKPVDLEKLIRVLTPFMPQDLPGAANSTAMTKPTSTHHSSVPTLPPPHASGVVEDVLQDPLDALPGIDMGMVLELLGGDRGMLVSLLNGFVNEFEGFPEEARKALEHGELDWLTSRLHTIKGTAGNLGLQAIAQEAGDLELALKTGKPTEALLDTLCATLAELLPALRKAANPKP